MFIVSVLLTCRVLTGQWSSFSSSVYNPCLEVLQRCNGSANNSPCKQALLVQSATGIHHQAKPAIVSLGFLLCITGQLIDCAWAAGQWWQAALGDRLPGCVNKETWKGGPVSLWPSIFFSADLYCQGEKNQRTPKLLLPCACGTPLLQVCCWLCSST